MPGAFGSHFGRNFSSITVSSSEEAEPPRQTISFGDVAAQEKVSLGDIKG